MLKSLTLLSLAAAIPLASAQSPDPAPQAAPDQSQPHAPIIRRYQSNGTTMHRLRHEQPQIVESQPISGVWLRSESTSALTTLSATPQRTELRLDHGRLNVTVHQPAQHSEILIDLPGGQTSLLKDGLYTFNADTNTVRVLRGEAAYIEPNATAKPIKIKEDHQLSLVSATPGKPSELKSVESYPYELTADLLPPNNHGEPDYPRYAGEYPYEYPYPYYADAWGYPYGYGFYPAYYSYGYPFAYGFGYHGGFRR
jgi:hypothetical protein